MKTLFLLFLIPILSLVGCASRPLITDKNVAESRVEIAYTLGHSHYKYTAVASEDSAEVASLRDNLVLEKKSIPLPRYQEFASKVEEAFKSLKSEAPIEDCRTPYTIRVTSDGQVQTRSGCRSADTDGKVSRLLKEGEFLFYAE